MAGGRQAWCPRCDELRSARPGATCPVCGRQLLTVPPARPGQPQPQRAERAGRRLRALLPAAGAFGVALLVVVVVASAFAAGRLTRTTSRAAGAAPTSTVPDFLDDGPETGRRTLNWEAQSGGITVGLRSLTVGTGFSRLQLHIEGVPRRREVSALERLRIRDQAGKDLLPGGELASIATAASRPAGGGIDTEVVLDRALDRLAVASVELGGLTVTRYVNEQLSGSLVDRELQAKSEGNADNADWLSSRRDCPGCRLRVACEECRSLRVAGWAYRRGRITIVVQALGRVEQSALNPAGRQVTVTDERRVVELASWIDGTGDTGVISAQADQLAASRLDDTAIGDPMRFTVELEAQAEQAIRGTWTIRQPGGAG